MQTQTRPLKLLHDLQPAPLLLLLLPFPRLLFTKHLVMSRRLATNLLELALSCVLHT